MPEPDDDVNDDVNDDIDDVVGGLREGGGNRGPPLACASIPLVYNTLYGREIYVSSCM
jgi:hypothetical protein